MKCLLLFVVLLFASAGDVTAQRADRHAELPGSTEPDPIRVDELTRQMCNLLRLNEAQYIQLRALNQAKLARLEEISWQYGDDLATQRAQLSELEARYEAECSRIFTPSQLSVYQAEQRRDAVPTKPDPSEGGLG